MPSIFTIGHSTRALDVFLALLEREGIQRVADVRRFPFSRRLPYFNGDALRVSLAEQGIAYRHMEAMGGRRDAPKSLPASGWREPSFNAYAHHMTTPAFRSARDSLLADSDRVRTAIMCAEAVPWRCHRNLISDSLVAAGWEVLHIMDAGLKPHELTSFASIQNGEVEYSEPVEEQQSLF